MRNQLNFFEFKFGKDIKFFELADINTKSAFRLNRFLFVDMLFGNVGNEYMPRSHLLCKVLLNFLEHFRTLFCACFKNLLELSLWYF